MKLPACPPLRILRITYLPEYIREFASIPPPFFFFFRQSLPSMPFRQIRPILLSPPVCRCSSFSPLLLTSCLLKRKRERREKREKNCECSSRWNKAEIKFCCRKFLICDRGRGKNKRIRFTMCNSVEIKFRCAVSDMRHGMSKGVPLKISIEEFFYRVCKLFNNF